MAKGTRRVVGLGAGGLVEVERGDGARFSVARAGLPSELRQQADDLEREGSSQSMAGRIDTGNAPALTAQGDAGATDAAGIELERQRMNMGTPTEVARVDPSRGLAGRIETDTAPTQRGGPRAPVTEETDRSSGDATEFVDPGAGPQTPNLSAVQPVQYATKTSRQVERQVSTPEYLKAAKEQQEAERALGEVQIARAEQDVDNFHAQAQLSEKATQIEEAATADRERVRRERAERVKAKLAERDAAEADFAATEIDPDRGLWVNKSAGAQIAAAIGLALSGVGSALARQENLAMKVLDGIVERDIQAQRANMEKKRVRVEMLDGAYARMRQAGLDDDDAAEAARIAHLRVIDRQVATHEAAAKSADAKAKIGEMRAGLAANIAAKETALQQSLAGKEAISSVTAPVGGGGAAAANAARPDAGIPGFVVTDPAAVAGLDNVELRQLRSAVSGATMLRQAAAKMVEIRNQVGSELTPSQAKSEFEIHRGSMIGAMNQLREAGVVNDNEYQRLSEEIPTLSPKMSDAARAVGYDPTLEKLKGIERGLMAQVDAKLNAFGGRLQGGAGSAQARSQLGEVP